MSGLFKNERQVLKTSAGLRATISVRKSTQWQAFSAQPSRPNWFSNICNDLSSTDGSARESAKREQWNNVGEETANWTQSLKLARERIDAARLTGNGDTGPVRGGHAAGHWSRGEKNAASVKRPTNGQEGAKNANRQRCLRLRASNTDCKVRKGEKE